MKQLEFTDSILIIDSWSKIQGNKLIIKVDKNIHNGYPNK